MAYTNTDLNTLTAEGIEFIGHLGISHLKNEGLLPLLQALISLSARTQESGSSWASMTLNALSQTANLLTLHTSYQLIHTVTQGVPYATSATAFLGFTLPLCLQAWSPSLTAKFLRLAPTEYQALFRPWMTAPIASFSPNAIWKENRSTN